MTITWSRKSSAWNPSFTAATDTASWTHGSATGSRTAQTVQTRKTAIKAPQLRRQRLRRRRRRQDVSQGPVPVRRRLQVRVRATEVRRQQGLHGRERRGRVRHQGRRLQGGRVRLRRQEEDVRAGVVEVRRVQGLSGRGGRGLRGVSQGQAGQRERGHHGAGRTASGGIREDGRVRHSDINNHNTKNHDHDSP